MKKLTAAAGPGAALIAGSLEGAGTALADELSYLQAIDFGVVRDAEVCP